MLGGKESLIRLCICDDRALDLEKLQTLTLEFTREHPDAPLRVRTFQSPYDVLEYLDKNGGFDIYLLDVIMPHMTGIELARRIRERGEPAEILFLTTSREYALEAFEVHATQYLLKPVEKGAFEHALLDAVESLAQVDNPVVMLKVRGGVRKVRIRELVMAESFDHVCVCTLADGTEVEATQTLTSLTERLSGDPRFFSPHRTYLVNLEYVEGLTGLELLLPWGKRMPVSRKLFGSLKKAYMEYVF